MTTLASGNFHNGSFDEAMLDETDGRRLTQATIRQTFDGDLVGSGTWITLMCYAPDGTAEYVGMLRVDGRIGELTGSFVLNASGTYDGREARTSWTVVGGSGTGGFTGLAGGGHSVAPHGPDGTYTLEYDLH